MSMVHDCHDGIYAGSNNGDQWLHRCLPQGNRTHRNHANHLRVAEVAFCMVENAPVVMQISRASQLLPGISHRFCDNVWMGRGGDQLQCSKAHSIKDLCLLKIVGTGALYLPSLSPSWQWRVNIPGLLGAAEQLRWKYPRQSYYFRAGICSSGRHRNYNF